MPVTKNSRRFFSPGAATIISDTNTLEGTALRYNHDSYVLLSERGELKGLPEAGVAFVERMAPGVFADSLRREGGNDIQALIEHSTGRFLGRTGSGSFKLIDGPDQLRTSLELPTTGEGPFVKEMVARGDYAGMSVRFAPTSRDAEKVEFVEGVIERTVESARLFEVSVTAAPAHRDTALSLRSLVETYPDLHEQIADYESDRSKRDDDSGASNHDDSSSGSERSTESFVDLGDLDFL